MHTLKNGEMAVVTLTKEKIIELLNDAIVDYISYIAKVENELTNLVIHTQFFEDNAELPMIVFAVEDSDQNALDLNFSKLAETILVKQLCKANCPLYISKNEITSL